MHVVLFFQSLTKASGLKELTGLQEIAQKNGWHVQVIDGLPDVQRIALLLDFWHPVGAIIECGGGYADIDLKVFGKLPVVFLDRDPATLSPNACCVYHDSVATGREAAHELLLTGYGHFAFVPFPEKQPWSEERGRGFSEALRLNDRDCSVFRGSASAAGPLNFQKRLRSFLTRLPKPCAVFAANDHTAEEVMMAANSMSISVPDDIAVVGVDNFEPICEHTFPSLSSVEPDFRRGGRLSAVMLGGLVWAGGKCTGPLREAYGPLGVVRRTSTRRLVSPDKNVLAAVALIRREACSGLRSEKVLAAFPCSRRLAEMRFRKATGHSVLDEIHAVRLDCAKMFLKNPNQLLKPISDFCGFKYPNSLRKFFLKDTGLTLSEWRSRHSS